MSDGSQHTGQIAGSAAGAAATGFALGGPVGAVTLGLVSLATGIIGSKKQKRASKKLKKIRRQQQAIGRERLTEQEEVFEERVPVALRGLETTLRERGITRGATADVARDRIFNDIQRSRAEFSRRERELKLGIQVPRIQESLARSQSRLGNIQSAGNVAALLMDPRVRGALGGVFGGGGNSEI